MTGRLTLGAFTHLSWRALAASVVLSLLIAVPLSEGLLAGAGGSQTSVAGTDAGSGNGLSKLPPAARAAISSALGADEGAYRILAAPDGFRASNPAQHLDAAFDASKVLVRSRTLGLGIGLGAVGYGDSLRPVDPVKPKASENRVTYSHVGVSEWYVNGPLGIEQGFTIGRAPEAGAAGPLTLAMTLSGDARVALGAGGKSATIGAGAGALRYGGVSATDASGRALPSWLTLVGRRLEIHVGVRDARFPVKVDPLIESKPEAKLTLEEQGEHNRFGMSVALSGDGKTAVVGTPWENGGTGGAWVFTRGEDGWVQSGPMLTIPAAEGMAGDCGHETAEEIVEGGGSEGEEADECRFGRAVGVDERGDMLAIGAPRAHSDAGGVWIYTLSGSTWTESSELVSPGGGKGAFGRSLAVSGDGETVLVGEPQAATGTGGAAWVFTHGSSTWEPAGPLGGNGSPNEGSFGRSVALSANGETALIGAPGIAQTQGAAWVFTSAGTGWGGSGARLTGGGTAEVGFGMSVALSGEGSTALVGAPEDNEDVGAAWVFTNSGSGWSESPSMLGGSGAAGEEFGNGVALSADGTHALVGAGGAIGKRGDALLFESSGEGWGVAHARLTGGKYESGSALFGTSVALSFDGETMLAGAGHSEGKSGGAWVFGPYPAINSVWPPKGPSSGGTAVEIKGEHIDAATAVRFGSNEAASFSVEPDEKNGEERIIAISPRGMGTVDIRVETPVGISSRSELDLYKYTSKSNEQGGSGNGGGSGGGSGNGSNGGNGNGGTNAGGAGESSTGGTVGLSAGSVLAFGPVASGTCTVSLLSKKIAVQPHSLALFKLRGTGSAKCAGKLKLTVRRKVGKKKYKTKVIGTASFFLAPGKNVAIKVRLNAAGRALLKAGKGRLGASLLLTKASPTPVQARTAGVRLTRLKPHPPKKT